MFGCSKMSNTTILLFLLHFSLFTFLPIPTHSKPLLLPHLKSLYLSPTTISPNYQNMLKSFKIFIYPPNTPFTFPSPSQSLFYTRLQDSPFATETAEDAHLFFVPFPAGLPIRSIARVVRTFRSELPYWNRTLGADHFYLSCDGLGYESDRNLVELKKNSVQISCFPTPAGKFIPHKDISLPPLVSSHAPTTNKTTSVLGYARFNWVKESTLVNELSSDPEFLIESEPSGLNTYSDRLGSSKFCLFQYGGGDVSGIGEALRFGCVPAVITDRPIQDLPFSDVLRWQEIAVFVGRRGGVGELKRVLARTRGERLEKMREVGVAASRHFVWNETPQPFDSFNTLMYQLWLRRHTIRYVRREGAL